MNILFLSVGEFSDIAAGSVHIDLVRQLASDGHSVYVACKNERRYGHPTQLVEEYGLNILRIKTGNIKKTNIIEKGISTILLEYQFLYAIKKYWSRIKFDVVMYHTPPITFTKVIKYIKKRDNAKSYLLLKDIFPQNAVDMGMFKQNGILYKYFRRKEKKMYAVSDRIGCMSEANCQYLLDNNLEISPSKVEISPNSILIKDFKIDSEDRIKILTKYGLPTNKIIFVYGGNLGKPQGVPFIMECLDKCSDINEVFFLIVGNGTEYTILKEYYEKKNPKNVLIKPSLPKSEYELLINACDVGLVFLDYNFKIPNYPSRILSYLQSRKPILCVTDPVTDVGSDMERGDCGWRCQSSDSEAFRSKILQIVNEDISRKGVNGFNYMKENFDVSVVAKKLIDSINNI